METPVNGNPVHWCWNLHGSPKRLVSQTSREENIDALSSVTGTSAMIGAVVLRRDLFQDSQMFSMGWAASRRPAQAWVCIYSLRLVALRHCHSAAVCTFLPCCSSWIPPALQARQRLDVCPKTCPMARTIVFTDSWWFAWPHHLHRPGYLQMQPLSARCMRILSRFQKGVLRLPSFWAAAPRHASCPALVSAN